MPRPQAIVEPPGPPPYEPSPLAPYSAPVLRPSTPGPSDVLALSTRHSDILSAISALDYAAPALEQQELYVKDLTDQLDQLKKRLVVLEGVTKKEKAEADALAGSHARRLAYKLSGRKEKFEERATKEQREYAEALEEQMRETSNLITCEQDLSAMVSYRDELKAKVADKAALERQLDAMYSSVFDGPSPSFPEEDALEQAFIHARSLHFSAQALLSRESQVRASLTRAAQAILFCLTQLRDAEGYEVDLWGWDSEVLERESLKKAEIAAYQVRQQHGQAVNLQPLVKSIGDVTVDQRALMGDLFSDNTFGAVEVKIRSCFVRIRRAHIALKAEIVSCQEREAQAKSTVEQLAAELSACRARLGEKRREIFATICARGRDGA